MIFHSLNITIKCISFNLQMNVFFNVLLFPIANFGHKQYNKILSHSCGYKETLVITSVWPTPKLICKHWNAVLWTRIAYLLIWHFYALNSPSSMLLWMEFLLHAAYKHGDLEMLTLKLASLTVVYLWYLNVPHTFLITSAKQQCT